MRRIDVGVRRREPATRKAGLRRGMFAAVLLPALAGGFMLQSLAGGDGRQVFQEVLSRVSAFGVDSIGDDSLYAMAARGLIRRIGDPYAELFSPEQLAEFQRENLRNGYGGMGMLVELVRDTATVARVYPHTPAEDAGVRVGDRIVRVEGQGVTGIPLDQVTAKLLGPEGSTVRVTFVRHGAGAPREIEARRRVVHIPVVTPSVMLDGQVGYVPLDRFSESAAEEMYNAVANLRKSGAKAFVIDLRGNGGGSLDQSIRISNLFVDKGDEILRVVYRNAPTEVYRAAEQPLLGGEPVVVLTDEGTASASEIVAGALQDHDRAVVVGMPSFGKGLVQDLFRLDGGWALKLTTGKWYTPSGRSIQRERHVLPDGSFAADDTVPPTDSALAARPKFRSDAGRTVFGGGGITPDLVVRADTLEGPERALMRTLSLRGGTVNRVVSEMSFELLETLRLAPGFQTDPAWREELFRRLKAAGVEVDRREYDAGGQVVDRILASRLSSLAFGDADVFRRQVPRDNQLQAALGIVRGARTQAEAFARVPAATAGPATVAANGGE
ncbi:MAG TPA: S41 family peptidase [Longimicrobium sp.]|nr:S41 family peptidase [Longimicrobium sp.]